MRLSAKHLDMTTGSPWKVILQFSYPLILGNILQQIYALTDSAVVGQFVGLDALASIGGTSWIRWAILGVCTDCAAAFSISAAQRIGAGDISGFKQVVAAGVKFGLILALIFPAILLIALDPALHALQIQANIYADARLYLLLTIISIPACTIYNMACAFLRAAGNSRGPFLAVLGATILNVILDLWFVARLHWGVTGAAVATLLAQLLSAVIVLSMTLRREPYRTTRANWTRNPALLKETAMLWIPMFWNSIAISLGGMIVQRYINSCGSVIAAGITAGTKIYCFLETVEKAICSGISVYVGQNLGARQILRIRQGMRSMTVVAFVFSALLALGLQLCGDTMIRLFLNQNQDPADLELAYTVTKTYLNVQSAAVFLMVPMHFYRGAIQALGHAVYPLIAGVMQVIARALSISFLPGIWGLAGMCMPDGAAALIGLPLVIIPYLYHIHHLQSRQPPLSQQC